MTTQPTHVVQFTTMPDFIADLTAGHPAAVYYDLHEQRTAAGSYGVSTWQLTTVIRAIVANGNVTHLAALTFPHGRPIERIYGRLFGPPGIEATDDARWNHARDRHTTIIAHLHRQLDYHHLYNLARPGILHVPNDLPLVYAPHPDEPPVTDAAADYTPEVTGSPD